MAYSIAVTFKLCPSRFMIYQLNHLVQHNERETNTFAATDWNDYPTTGPHLTEPYPGKDTDGPFELRT